MLEHTRTIDLEHWRTRVQQRLKMDFVFASTAGQLGLNRTNETLDGDIAYNIGGGFLAAPQPGRNSHSPRGRGRPPASRGAARPSDHDRAGRARSDEQAVEPPEAGRPAARRRHRASGRHADAGGEWHVESSCVGQLRRAERQPRGRHVSNRICRLRAGKGIQLPTGIATTIDFRNVVQSKLYVDRNIVDAPIDDLSAPASVRSAPPQVRLRGQRQPEADEGRRPRVVHERQHVLRIRRPHHHGRGQPQDAALQAILKVVNALVPGKRVTQVIQTHHHFDHSVGFAQPSLKG